MACLDEGTIVDLVSGALGSDQEAAAKRHLDECDACRELVAELTRSLGEPESGGPLARGNTIGRYVVVDVVGAGGMGVVYAAYDPELDRKVAVKLLRRDLSTSPGHNEASVGELGRRLLREAKAMARLSHPNVVAVHDAGTTPDGQVFVAMEFVPGTSLGKWLAVEPRPYREVLAVYEEAALGLAAAHEAGLVHRDFKPDNVMIEPRGEGREARVLVTDFGLARPIARTTSSARIPLAAGQDEAQSQLGAVAGTPAYMAPEQFRGEPATALTDQFGFCVALYEGLYGEHPFGGKSFEEIEENVIAGRVREAPKDAKVPAKVRAVLLRGLSRSPQARHPSMQALLDALHPRRFRPKRRFIIATAVVLVALAAVGGYRGANRGRLLCTGAERKLAGVWDGAERARIAQAFARSGKPYAADAWRGAEKTIDQYTRGWVAMRTDACEATRLRGEQSEQLLDRRVECLDGHLRQLAALTRLFSEADEEVVSRAVEASLALPRLAECANATALKAGVRPPADPALADRVQNARIKLARATALEGAGKYTEARALLEPIVTEARQIAYLPLEAEADALDGRVSGRLEDMARAEGSLRHAAEGALAAGDDAVAAHALVDLAYFLGHKAARYDEGQRWSRYAKLAIERLGGDDELEADRLETLSIIAWRQGKEEEALSSSERALVLYRRVLGEDHPKVAHSLDGVATVYSDVGRIEEAYELDSKALAIAERSLGPNHPLVSMYLNNVGDELRSLGRYPDAVASLRHALAIAEKNLGPEHADTVAPLDTLGDVLTSMGKYDEALATLERAKSNLAKAGHLDSPDYASVLNDMGVAEVARGRPTVALERHAEALAVVAKAVGEKTPDYGLTLLYTGQARLALGKPKEALADLERALEIVQAALGPEAPGTAKVLVAMGNARLRLADPAGALPLLERATRTREARRGDPRDLADARFALAQALWASGGDRERARKLGREARAALVGPPWFKERLAAIDAWLADVDARVTRGG